MNTMTMNGMNGVNGANGTMAMMNPALVNGTGSGPGPVSGSKPVGMSEMEAEMQTKLNTSIYDYFLKHEQYDCARAILKSELKVVTKEKRSPGRGQDVNGMDDHSGDDSKDKADKKPDDLPAAGGQGIQHDTSFLLDWFSLFWDMFFAQRKAPNASQNALTYVYQQNRQREQQQRLNGYLQPGAMQGGMNYQGMIRMPGGMPMKGSDLQRQMINRNLTPSQMQGLQAAKQQQMLQMQREGSEMALNGQRPRTPSADNAPSPSKRPRLDVPPPFNGAMMPNSRPGQGVPNPRMMAGANQARNMLAAQGMQPGLMSQTQVETFGNQPQHIQDKAIQMLQQNLPENQRNGMPQPHFAGQGSPMMPSGLDASGMEIYGRNNVQMAQGQNGNHALQDYQMQLMLLEQQNKKRLMMARQEQDNQSMRPDGQPAMPGQPGGFPQGMSPQGSRSGPSPNPTDQMKRGTPKMGQVGLPGSPMPDGSMPQGRNSPGMGFGMQGDVFQNGLTVGPNGPMMRPPSSHPGFQNNTQFTQQQHMEAIRQQQQQQQNGNRLQNPAWQAGPPGPGPMMPQPGQGQQPAPIGTPRQQHQNAMGPPAQAPPGPAAAADGQRPRSPAQLTNPPTPSQANKANPKAKKDGKEAQRKRPTKKNSVAVANTPAADAENAAPATTPSTPVPNQHTVNGKAANGPNPNAAALQAPTSIAPPPPTNSIPQASAEPHFAIDPEQGIDMNFGNIDSENVLTDFDFDSFLQENVDPGEMGFGDASMAFANFGELGPEAVE